MLLPRALARLFHNTWAVALPPLADDDADAAMILHDSTRVQDPATGTARLYRLHYLLGTRAWTHRPQPHKQCVPMGSLEHGTVILASPSSTAGWLKLAGGLGYVKQTVRGRRRSAGGGVLQPGRGSRRLQQCGSAGRQGPPLITGPCAPDPTLDVAVQDSLYRPLRCACASLPPPAGRAVPAQVRAGGPRLRLGGAGGGRGAGGRCGR